MDDTLQQLIADILGLDDDEVNEESNNQTIEEWDSMAQVNLASALEGEYGITLSTENMAKLTSVSAVIDVLKQQGIS